MKEKEKENNRHLLTITGDNTHNFINSQEIRVNAVPERFIMYCSNYKTRTGPDAARSNRGARHAAWLAISCVIPALMMGCQGSGNSAEHTAAAPVPAVNVETVHASVRDVSRLISLPADVRPWQEATLYSRVPGTLSSILVDRGDSVKTGQLLATISASELSSDADLARASAKAAEASALAGSQAVGKSEADKRKASTELQRLAASMDGAVASEKRATDLAAQAEAGVKQAETQRLQAAAALDEARAQDERYRAELGAASAEQKLAMVTYERYRGIYAKNPMLLAKQELDTAEARFQTAQGKASAARSILTAAEAHIRAVQAQLDSASAAVEQAKAAARASRDQIQIATSDRKALERAVASAEQEVESRGKSVEISRSGKQEAQSRSAAAHSFATRAGTVAGYTQIFAPFAGTVTRRNADPGAFIQTAAATTSAAPIVTISDLTRLRVQVNIPETEAQRVNAGGGVIITDPSVVGLKIKAKIARTAGTLDPKSRTLAAEVDLANSPRVLTPGAYALVKVVLETHKGVISLPAAAVASDKSGKFVYAVSGGKAVRKNVEVGFSDGEFTEIKTGLTPADEIVVTGRDAVTPQGPVTTSPYVPKAPPAPAK